MPSDQLVAREMISTARMNTIGTKVSVVPTRLSEEHSTHAAPSTAQKYQPVACTRSISFSSLFCFFIN